MRSHAITLDRSAAFVESVVAFLHTRSTDQNSPTENAFYRLVIDECRASAPPATQRIFDEEQAVEVVQIVALGSLPLGIRP